MATENWKAGTHLKSSSSREGLGSSNDFFELVRRLEKIALKKNNSDPHRSEKDIVTLGDDGLPSHEVLRFRGNYSLGFPGSPVEELKLLLDASDEVAVGAVKNIAPEGAASKIEHQKKHEVVVNFMGLSGPSGVLPQHYSRLILDRIKHKDYALADFIDLFNHRLISLFYRSWMKYRFSIQREHFDLKELEDPFTKIVGSLSGKNERLDHDAQQYYAGHFSKKNKSVSNLELILRDFLDTPVVIESFVGQWLTIDKKDRAKLSSRAHGTSQRLGEGIMLGRRCWDVASKVTITIGTIGHETYQLFLPGTKKYDQIKALIENYIPVHINVDMKFTINDTHNNCRKLGGGLRLRQNVWLQGSSYGELVSKFSLSRKI